ncbi:aminotransferase class I/II-fold pyridoxal phosphate-dependent enzyme [Rubrobacter tropicus]|uniref:Aminotransferase class I/II-fold pyridoxal phosphate-dependent enzyme n=2 Tax=Rubrobacter tropicus TaxID=2653851 RepID=A0A6G8QFL9_9ACTN|nr:aminotransferase class I/II-fold pyridoxal phosphate-dependent enzyme [Rubrobacter tropicus]
MRAEILAGRLPARARLPSTRAVAAELGVSRTTVVAAFDQLLAEGYLEGRAGSGTYVAPSLPDDMLGVRGVARSKVRASGGRRALSRRGEVMAATPTSVARDRGVPRAFRPGVPATQEFPFGAWRRLVGRVWRRPSVGLLGYGEPAGYGPLRREISAHLGPARAVRCGPEQVIVVSGSQQALDLCARVLLDPGDAVWVEEPGYRGARAALLGAGATLVPVPVDAEGLDVGVGIGRDPDARLACVTPSHQYPLGVTMSLARRLELLRWAGRSSAWILEDDYDSEYRYSGRPLEALQGLDTEGRVIYVGTFSKVLFPSLRLGYLIVPPDLVDAFTAARELSDRQPPGMEQAVLAHFMAEGHFARHVRRTRSLYAERQALLVEEAAKHLSGLLDVPPAGAGMHLVGRLPAGKDDREASRRAAGRGVEAPAISLYGKPSDGRGGLMLGYAAVDEAGIRQGVRRLAQALE